MDNATAASAKPSALPNALGTTGMKDPFAGIVTGNAKSDAYMRNIIAPNLRQQSELGTQLGQAQADQKAAELDQKILSMQQETKATDKYATDVRDNVQKYRDQMAQWPDPEFHPTKDNAESLGQLFSLVATMGMMLGSSGKLSAMNAMNAMGGMLKGWQQGRLDLWKREKDEFEKQLEKSKAVRERITKELELANSLAATDRDAAMKHADTAAAIAGRDSLVASYIKTGRLQSALDVTQKAGNLEGKVYEKLAANEEAMRKLAVQHQYRMQEMKARSETGRTSALLAGRAENIREAFTQAALDLKNVSKFPKGTVLGAFSGMTGQEGPTLISSLSNTFARTITDRESRQFQQLISGLEANMSMALGGGYASSGTKFRIDMYKAQMPKTGDDGYVAAMFLARVKQELNNLAENFASKPGATKEMDAAVQKSTMMINDAIPFNVDDVMVASQNAPQKTPSSWFDIFKSSKNKADVTKQIQESEKAETGTDANGRYHYEYSPDGKLRRKVYD